MVSNPDSVGHRGQRRVDRADAREEARVDDVQVVDLVRPAIGVQNRRGGIGSEPDRARLVGMPEAQIILSEAVLVIATSPKSPEANAAVKRAMADVEAGVTGEVPAHLRDAHYPGAAAMGHGAGYLFPHDHRLNENAYTVLESTNYSIQIDVLASASGAQMGVMLTSNSNGTYFTRNAEHTNSRAVVVFNLIAIGVVPSLADVSRTECKA